MQVFLLLFLILQQFVNKYSLNGLPIAFYHQNFFLSCLFIVFFIPCDKNGKEKGKVEKYFVIKFHESQLLMLLITEMFDFNILTICSNNSIAAIYYLIIKIK